MRPTLLLALLLSLTGCAKARHVAVQIDLSYSTVLFNIDDTQYRACHTTPAALPADQCARLDGIIKKALLDGQALTAALQATPQTAAVPKSLADVLADLNAFSLVLSEVQQSPTFATLATQVNSANTQLLTLLRQLGG